MRTNLGFLLARIFPLLAAAALCAACGDDDKADGDAGTGTDTDSDTDTDTDTVAGWEGAGIDDVRAPDEFTVVVTFSGAPPAADAANAAIYAFSSEVGGLAIESIAYDEAARQATLTTEKQKLGIRYTVTITPPADGAAPLTDDFLSANTATFWTLDYASATDVTFVQKTAARFAVGESCVVYVEVGYYAPAESMMQTFDELSYPIETETFIDAPDQDGNGKIVILGIDGGPFAGGYFSPINTLSEEEAVALGYHSNEMELIVANVAVGYSDEDFDRTNAHEFNHLLYWERHGDWVWNYHAEGLGVATEFLVFGDAANYIDSYFADALGSAGQGDSLVDWDWDSNFHYDLSFMFWSYVAGQLGGLDGFADIFDMDTGSPEEVDAFFLERLGRDFGQVQLDQMIANYVQAETGAYGYEGLLDLDGRTPPHAAAGDSSYDLLPFGGTYFFVDPATVDYPGTQGANVVYTGINGSDEVDYDAPFDVDGGVLVVLNSNMGYEMDTDGHLSPIEHSGPDLPATDDGKGPRAWSAGASPTWRDPPPFDPWNPAPFEEWLDAARKRVDKE
jgi:hypothetical protein